MHDAERIGVLGTGQEAADGAAVVDLLEPRAVGRGETGRFCELAEAWRNWTEWTQAIVETNAEGVTSTRDDGS